MANIRIADTPQRIQYVATASQTVFAVPFPFLVNTDIVAYQNSTKLAQGGAPGQYGLSGAGTASGGTLTLVTGASVNDIITIFGDTPVDRTSIYSPTVSNLTGDDLNNDFNRDILMIKQQQTTQDFLQLQYAPYASVSQDATVTVDRWLPILPAGGIWRKNDGNTAIEAAVVPAFPVGSFGGNFTQSYRLVRTNISTGANEIEQMNVSLTDSPLSMQSTTGSFYISSAVDLNLGATQYLNLKGQRWPNAIGSEGQVIGAVGGVLAYMDVPTVEGPTTIDQIPMYFDTFGGTKDSPFARSGNNLLLPADPTVALAAATKQYVDAATAGAALTEVNDTNVTLTLGGSPATALLRAASITVGWAGQLAVTRGGTGLATVAQGDLFYGSALNTISALAKDTNATRYLSNTGASNNPAWAQIDLTNGVTGVLPSANGGSGVASPTAHGVLIGEGASPFTPIVLGAGQILIGTTASDPVAAAIGSGSGILVGNASGAITISNTGVLSNVATANQTTVSGATGNVTIGIASNPVLPGTGGVTLPTGNTAARAGAAGTIRYNSQTGLCELTNDGAAWSAISVSSGTVTSVSGTANQIDSTGGATPVLSLSSTVVFPGTVTLNADPVSALQAVTKQYADAIAAGFGFKVAVVAATTGALTVTYANGVAGVGATLTNAGAQAAFSIDGQSPSANQRVLIKNQASNVQNGIYTVTTVGSGATNWVLTRATDFDQPSEIFPGAMVPITAGTVNADTSWFQSATVTTIGTDPITFSQFSSAPLALPVSMANGGTNASLTASNGGIFYSTGSAGAILSGTATAQQLLMSGASTTPIWSTSTYPTTNAINTLLYASSANVMAALATANSSVLVTSSGGVPSLSTALPSGLTATNLTLTTPALGTPSAGVLTNCTGLPVAGGGTGNSTFTAYSVICAGTTATGAFQNVSGVGSAGQVLTSNGASALPTWQASAGGSGTWVLLTSNTSSSSSISEFKAFFSSSYDMYCFELWNVTPASNGVVMQAQLGTGATPTYITTNYNWGVFGGEQNAGYQNNMTASDTLISITAPAARTGALVSSTAGVSGTVYLFGTNGSANTTQGSGQLGFFSSSSNQIEEMISFSQPSATITAIKFFFSSGNIASGTIRMYGIKNS